MAREIGADVDQLRALAKRFTTSADRLQQSSSGLSGVITNAAFWRGTDADTFRTQWRSQSNPSITTVVKTLRSAADALVRNADEQDQASAAGGATTGTPGSPASSGAFTQRPTKDGLNGMWDEINHIPNGENTSGYRVEKVIGPDGVERYVVYIGGTWGSETQSSVAGLTDAVEAAKKTFNAAAAAAKNAADAAVDAARKALDAVRQTAADFIRDPFGTLARAPRDIADTLTKAAQAAEQTAKNAAAAAEQARQAVMAAEKHLAAATSDIVDTVGANANAAANQLDKNQIRALEKLIPPGAEVMLVGHSQGGMDAQNIAMSGRLNVTQVVTFGSPVRGDLDVPAIHLQADGDPVPGLAAGVPGPYFNSAGPGSSVFSGESNMQGDGLAIHAKGYDNLATQFDNQAALGGGRAAGAIGNLSRFQGTVVDQVDIGADGSGSW